jgi:hypothetical protein
VSITKKFRATKAKHRHKKVVSKILTELEVEFKAK